jgi:hypothetical protein
MQVLCENTFFYLIHQIILKILNHLLPNLAPQKLAFPFTPLVFWYKYVLK